MNGLLHRLAAATIGKGLSVRSNARLPFNQAALASTDVAEAAPRSLARHPGPMVPPPTGMPHAVDTTRQLLPRLDEHAAEPTTADPTTHSSEPERTRQRPPVTVSLAPPAKPKVERMSDAAPPEPLMPVWPAIVPIETPGAPVVAPSREARRGRPDQSPSGTTAARPDRELKTAPVPSSVGDAPSPLLPWAAPRSAPRPSPVERPRVLDSGGADEGTEIHIHIGRIEVTAVQAPPPPRRKVPSIPPVSLDEYLAKRSRT
jgi:hypothetical protein